MFAANNHYPITDAFIGGARYWVTNDELSQQGAYQVQADPGTTLSVSAPNCQTGYTVVGNYAQQVLYLTWIGAWPQQQTY